MAQVALSLVSPHGVELPLASDPWAPGAYRVMDGTAGLGLPVSTPSFTESAGDGRRLGNVRTSGRLITLALGIFTNGREETAAAIDRLAETIGYVDGKPLPKLRARFPNGDAREIEFVHTGGGTEGLTALGEDVTRPVLTLDCPDAFWTAVDYAEPIIIRQTDDGTTFLETLPRVYLQPSDAFGTVTITNPGKVPSWVDWELRGPFTRVEATRGDESWAFESPVLAGEVIYIRKTPAGIEVVDATGASRYSAIGDVPRFFQLPPGQSTITVELTGTSLESSVVGRWRPRYKQVF